MTKNNQNIVDEINYQIRMIKNLNKWLRNSMVFSSFSLAVIIYANTYSIWFTIIGWFIFVLSIISSILIGFVIRRGQEKVQKMILIK